MPKTGLGIREHSAQTLFFSWNNSPHSVNVLVEAVSENNLLQRRLLLYAKCSMLAQSLPIVKTTGVFNQCTFSKQYGRKSACLNDIYPPVVLILTAYAFVYVGLLCVLFENNKARPSPGSLIPHSPSASGQVIILLLLCCPFCFCLFIEEWFQATEMWCQIHVQTMQTYENPVIYSHLQYTIVSTKKLRSFYRQQKKKACSLCTSGQMSGLNIKKYLSSSSRS